MRIDSRLMKTDIELDAIERREDRLLILSPPDDWNATKVYLSPQDVVKTIRLSLHRGMIVYLLLFPFFLAAQYLRGEKDIDDIIQDISYVVAAIFMGLLLLGGATFLLTEPLTGVMVLGILAGLFYLITIGSGKPGFLYLAVPLTVIAHFLLAFGQGVSVRAFPWLALGVALTLLILGKALGPERQSKMARPLYHTGYLVVLIFVGYILANARSYALEDPWGASLPLLAFSVFFFVRYLDTQEVFLHYAAAILLGGGFLLALYGIPLLPAAYYGLPLIALSMAMILIADRYHEAHGLAHVAPAYSVAILIALLAFVYAWQDLTALLLSLALFSVHFFGGTYSLGIKSTIDNWGEKSFQWTEFTLANLAAGCAALLMLTVGRANWASVIAAGVYVYYYRKMGFGREPTLLETRNQYLWVAGGFYALLVFVVLGLLDPFGSTQTDMLLVPPLLLPLLLYGRRVQKHGQAGPAASIYESSLLTVIIAITLPLALADYRVATASVVAGILLGLYLLLGLLWRDEVIFYALPILAAHLYYNGLVAAGVGGSLLGLLYLPPGLLGMAVALWLHRRGAHGARVFFLTWFVFSGASVLGAMADRILTIYLLAGWAALFVLAAPVVNQAESRGQVLEAGSDV
ncbi:MAG: hypothetical protein ACE5H9_10785 [Anaerolineae bacterium]